MSASTNKLNNGQQAITNYDLSKIFVFNNRYESGSLTNSEYDPMTINAGTVLGRIAGTGTLWPCISTATDGSQHPVGICAADVTIQDGTTATIPYCTLGDVIKDKVIMWNTPTDTLNTVVAARQQNYYDLINGLGIKLVDNSENTYLDNQ